MIARVLYFQHTPLFNLLTMSIGQNIRKVRELKNLTQSYIARQLGISVAAYSRIERNKTSISLQRLQQIATVLGTDTATILNFNEQEVLVPSAGIQALVSEIRLLREEIRGKQN